jgi:hypothetical protein
MVIGESTVLSSYPWENCPRLSLRLMLVPGGSTISLLPLGMDIDLPGIWTSSSGELRGSVWSATGAGDRFGPAGWTGWTRCTGWTREKDWTGCTGWTRGADWTGWTGGAGGGALLERVETGEINEPSDGTGGAPYTATGTWGDEYFIGMGGANSSMRAGLCCGDAATDVSSIMANWK